MKNILMKVFHSAMIIILINLVAITIPGRNTLAARESQPDKTNSSAPLETAKVSFEPITTGLDDPIFITHADDGSGRIFFVEQGGYIRILKNEVLLGTPFLDIHSIIKSGGEQGLLALAFHPSYATNGFFYVAYTAPRSGDSTGSNLVLRRFSVSNNPDVANAGSGVTLLTISHPTHSNHNGGSLAFGEDGYLYWSTGDGGSGGDPANNAQQLNNLLGKVLRIDVNSGSPYGIPASNPFYANPDPNIRKEIWAYGLRNPWRISFDRLTHDLYIGDVGQSAREEVDFQAAASSGGENYGWRVMEGSNCYNPSSGCNQTGKILPVAQYDHSLGCSITGGYVYRGINFPSLKGYYFYGDYCSGRIFSLHNDITLGWQAAQLVDTSYSISTFGEDENGELYLANRSSGTIYNIQYEEAPFVLSSVRANSNPTSQASVDFTVSFSEDVTGVDISDFALTTTGGITGASVSTVNGTGKNYTVTVATGSGNGTIRLDVVDDDSIRDVTLDPLGETGAGNGNFLTGEAYTLDHIPPVVDTITRLQPDPASNTRVDYSVTFSESVTGVNTTDFSLTTTGIVGAAVSGVSGSGNVYTVTVNTGTGNGTIRLDLLDDDTIKDIALNPLGGAGAGNGDFTSGEIYTINRNIETYVAGNLIETYLLAPSQSLRQNYSGIDSGPMQIRSTDGSLIIAALRDAWAVNGTTTSFSQLMGLPLSQISDKYVFPAYNNVTLNEQLRIGNVNATNVPSTVTVTIGGVLRATYTLQQNEAIRINYAGLDSGPVVVEGTDGVHIIAAIREAWMVNGVTRSFVQLMGLPASQLSNKYVFPAYNNVTLNEQLRIGNVNDTDVPSTVNVTIGGLLQGTYTLQQNEAIRINYAGLDSGPVVVEGTPGVDIIAAIRDAWQVNGVTTSFSQLMGMPDGGLSDQYIFPAYNNVTLNEQLRIANVDNAPTTVTVTIGGVLQGSYDLDPDEAVRINYAGLDSGPVVIQGTADVDIIAAIRDAWAVNGVTQSFIQLMGLPFEQLSTTYLFPAYNNVTLNEQLRFGIP